MTALTRFAPLSIEEYQASTALELARRVVDGAARLLRLARSAGLPVIHVILENRLLPRGVAESERNPFWRAVERAGVSLTPVGRAVVAGHNRPGSPGTQIIPELYKEGDYVINNKKRLDCFYGTDLRQLLQTLGVKNVVLMGINTNTCVLNTSFTAFNKNYRVVVLSDCVASMYGADLHVLGLQNVARCLGWVIDNATFRRKIEEGRKRNA